MERPEEATAPPDQGESLESPSGEAAGGAVETAAPATPEAADTVDYKDRWLRAEAELQNFRRRARRDLDETRRRSEDAVLLDLIAVLDDLERAVDAARDAGANEAWTQGVALTAQRGRDLLGRHGVEVVDSAGRPFDPHFHEAVLEVEPPAGVEPGTVTQVVHKGYRRGDRALRPARVVVARHHEGGND